MTLSDRLEAARTQRARSGVFVKKGDPLLSAEPLDDVIAELPPTRHGKPATASGSKVESSADDAVDANEIELPAGLEGMRDSATEALYERMGARITDSTLSEEQLHALARQELATIIAEQAKMLTDEQRRVLIEDIADDALGLGPLQRLLDDPSITEVMVNGPDHIYVERKGRLLRSSTYFRSEERLRRVIERIVSRVGRRIDESSPLVDARLPDGSRVNAIIPPLAVGGSALTIRKFANDPFQTQDLIDLGTITESIGALLYACVQARLNIIISGGTGTGKTTLLNVLSSYIPADDRVVTIEDAVELQLQQEHVVRLESRPPNIEGKGEVTIRDLVRNSLRMRPDRIVVGECRGGEALDMLQAMNTGHDGSLSTVHANSPRDAIARLETLSLMAGMDLPLRAVREQVASAIDVIIHVSRMRDGSRRVTHVTEVLGMEGDTVTLQDAFVFDYSAGTDSFGRFLGSAKATGLRPRFTDRFDELGISIDQKVFELGERVMTAAMVMGMVLCGLALAVGAVVVLMPKTATAAGMRNRTLASTDRMLHDASWYARFGERLELAGIRMKPAGVVTLVTVLTAGGVIVGTVLGLMRGLPWGLLFPLVFAALVLLGARAVIAQKVAKRRYAFAAQLDDTLQLMASGLRAGHSLPAALDAVANEAESPTAEEFARLLNKNRIGYDLAQAIEECAERMDCDDLAWTAQAVAIHREVGGNLGEVLDHVGDTIRERNQIRRQVRTLSAEGRISANVLIALPLAIAGLLAIISPDYIKVFISSPIGGVLIGISLVLFIVGVLWLRQITKIKF